MDLPVRAIGEPGTRGPYATPTGAPCPRTVHVDGTVDGTGACQGCGLCLLLGGLLDTSALAGPT